MGKPILYGIKLSPPVRSCLLTIKAIGLDIEFKEVNFFTGETKTPEFLKKNPQHTVPILEDEGKFICDSHAIVTYLVEKYGKNDALYPKDLYQRALVDQRLHFDSGIIFVRMRAVFENIIHKNNLNNPDEIAAIYEAYDFMEKFLETDKYLVGNSLTLADFCCVTTISSIVGEAPIDEKKHPKLTAWLKRMSQLPYYEKENAENARGLINLVKDKIETLRNK